MVGSTLGLYGLLRSWETMTLQVKDILNGLDKTLPGDSFDVEYPYTTKTQKEGFYFEIPAKYRCFFQAYRLQLSEGCDQTSRFLKNRHVRSKTRHQNLGIKKIRGWANMFAKLLNLPFSVDYSSHSFRRTGATILADAGIDMINLKRMGRWKAIRVWKDI